MTPTILDLFCGAGGCAAGYTQAGFRCVGVDINPQKNYPYEFHQADALVYLREHGHKFDAIHASPPCQGYSTLAAMHPGNVYPMLIEPVRESLNATGLPYVIENVPGSPLCSKSDLQGNHGVMLCGSMFNLGVPGRGYLRRHRIFETTFALPQPQCRHVGNAVGVYGHGGHSGKHRMLYRKEAAIALNIDWMNRDEMCQAIPPAYTKFIGEYLMAKLTTANQPDQPINDVRR